MQNGQPTILYWGRGGGICYGQASHPEGVGGKGLSSTEASFVGGMGKERPPNSQWSKQQNKAPKRPPWRRGCKIDHFFRGEDCNELLRHLYFVQKYCTIMM